MDHDFAPWYCPTCRVIIPVSALTHWDTSQQHTVVPNTTAGTSVPGQVITAWSLHNDTYIEDEGRGVIVAADNLTGTTLAEIKIVVARTRHGDTIYDLMAAVILKAVREIYAIRHE